MFSNLLKHAMLLLPECCRAKTSFPENTNPIKVVKKFELAGGGVDAAHLIFVIFLYATTFFGLKKVLQKVRKFASKIASRQNSVDFWLAYLVFWLAYLVFWLSYLIFCWRTCFFLGIISVLFIILNLLVCLHGILVGVLGFWLAYLVFLFGVYGILCVIFPE